MSNPTSDPPGDAAGKPTSDRSPSDPAGGAAPPVLVLVRDLMFSGKITATAAAEGGVRVKVIRDPAKLGAEPGRHLIVDLNLPGAIDAAARWREARGRPVVGFVAHTDADAIARARAAGLDRVLARSQFVNQLPDLLRAAGDPPARPDDAG